MIRFVPNKLKVALINKNKSCHLTILKVEIHIKGIRTFQNITQLSIC